MGRKLCPHIGANETDRDSLRPGDFQLDGGPVAGLARTIAVSENRQLTRIAQSTVISDNAFSIVVPLLDQVFNWRAGRIRALIESNGLALEEWEKARTDRVTITERLMVPTQEVA